MGLEVGQKLWFVGYRGNARQVTVTRIGRIWVTLEYPAHKPYRINPVNLEVDGGDYASPGQCYLSREVYENEKAVLRNWSDLIQRIHTPRPINNIGKEDLMKIKQLLGLEPWI